MDGYETAAIVGVVVAVNQYKAEQTKTLVSKLIARQIPFAFVPLGGSMSMRAKASQLTYYKNLISVNEFDEYSQSDQIMLSSHSRELSIASDINYATLDDMRPFISAPSGNRLKFYPHANPINKSGVVVHIVSEDRGSANIKSSNCLRRIGIQKKLFGENGIKKVK